MSLREDLEAFIAAHDNENWRGWGIPQALQRILDDNPEPKPTARQPHPATMAGRK
jgi:hypothetical protein